MKEARCRRLYQIWHVDIEPSKSIEVLVILEVNDVETNLGERFTMPFVAY
jgi:hypothetical protein